IGSRIPVLNPSRVAYTGMARSSAATLVVGRGKSHTISRGGAAIEHARGPGVVVNQQTSVVTTTMTAIPKQFQATPSTAFVKSVEEIYVTCGGAHPYYQCELKAITTRSGIVLDGPSVPLPPPFINLEEDERVEETLTDQDLAEYTIKVLPPLVQKPKPLSQRNYTVHQRDPLHPNIPYPLRMHKQKQQEKDEVQIHKFWQMFKQLHINITLADALILISKYQKMLKPLLSNKDKLLELANIPLNENCSAVILKKLPKKLGDPGKFLIPCGFSELKCKALANLGASINLMPLSVWKKLADFVIVDYESDPRVPLILGRPFLRTARALIDVHGKEMILRDGDERLTLNMKHDTSSYSNQPRRESVNLINIFNVSSEYFLEGCNVLSEKLSDLNYTKYLHPPLDDNLLSRSTTYSSNSFLEEFTDELALITYPQEYDDNLQFDIKSVFKEIEFLLYQDKDSSLKNSIDQKGLANLDAIFVDPIPEIYKDLLRACPHHGFTELHQLDTFYNALNPADQDSLNAAAVGNLLERHTQDVLKIIENKSKVCNSRSKSVVSQVKACDVNSFSEIAKLTHAVNQQTSALTTAMTAILEQFQANPPLASVKAVEETCVTCGGLGSLPSNTVANPNGKLKAITTRSGLVIDGPTIPTPPQSINHEVDERVEETFTDLDLAEYTIKVPPPPVQKYKPPSQREYVVHQRDPLHPNIPYPSRMLKQKQQEKDEVQIHKFWKMFKHLHINITLADALILMPNELKCKALADLGASINLMPLSVRKKLGLPELISTRMILELANRAICTPARIARDVFVPVGKFTFLADFVIVDYESDPRVPLILGRPFLRTARTLINVHGEEMILCDDDERLILNMRHDTSRYSNQPQKESMNLINVFNNSSEDFLKDLFSNQPSSNPTFSSHPELTSSKVNDDIFDSEGGNVLSEKLLDLDSKKDLHPPLHVNPLSGSTTYSSNPLLEEFVDELALITFPPIYDDDLQFDVESDLKEIEFLLHQDIYSSLKDSIDQPTPVDNFVDSIPEMFTDEHVLDYSSPSIFDEYDDHFLQVESNAKNVYDDC
nr:hypothetical protein [Tanacetum cinerariifolium]